MKKVVGCMSCVCILSVSLSVGQELLFTSPGGSERSDADGVTIGIRFTVGDSNLIVSALGVWDKGGDGLLSAHDVGLYTDAGSLITNATVPSGTMAALTNGVFRIVELGGTVTLTAGAQYRVGSLQAGSEPFFEGSATLTTHITNAERCYANGGGSLVFPVTTPGGAHNGYLQPNLVFTVQPPPPPPPPPEPGQWFSNATATASSADGANIPAKAVDAEGLSGPIPLTYRGPFPTQTANTASHWLSSSGDSNPYIVFDLKHELKVGWVHIWNLTISDSWNKLGTETADVYASSDNSNWTFIETLTLALVEGTDPDPGEFKTFEEPFTARYVKFEVTQFAGAPDGRTGFNEAAFYRAVPRGTLFCLR